MDFVSQNTQAFSSMESSIKNIIQEDFAKTTKDLKLNDDVNNLLSHLGNYIEEPYKVIESYFQGQHLERLVRHQLESYNHFINHQIEHTINMFNPVIIHSENDYIPEKDKYIIEIQINFKNFRILPPQIHENNGATKTMFPQEAKLRNFTYASIMNLDLHIQYTIYEDEQMETPKIIEKILPKINIKTLCKGLGRNNISFQKPTRSVNKALFIYYKAVLLH